MIKYKSTRGDKKRYSFSQALLKGIAEDGGLLVPEIIPQFTFNQLRLLLKKSYQQRAAFIFNLFQTDFSASRIKRIIKKAYSLNFDNARIVPVVHLKDRQYISELWHGPTSAFKDLALQIMPLFFSEIVKMENQKRTKRGKKPLRYLILVATSGDTGKAAMEGYKDKDYISIITLFPDGFISKLQELQMTTQEGNNVAVYALSGNFDAVQACIKDVFGDKQFTHKLVKQQQTLLSSANSINWGRLIPQIIYHINNYIELVNQRVIKLGEAIDITVPTGNFGNILAAFYAKKMGLPIRKLICASNSNNILTDFIHTGIYDISTRDLIQTPSPSMDILIASNIERLLYILTNSTKKVTTWMQNLKTRRKFVVDELTKTAFQREFIADWVSNQDCLANIKEVYTKTHCLLDPHTSVAQLVTERFISQESDRIPVIICATAHWAKFAKDIYRAFKDGSHKSTPDEFLVLKEINQLVPNSSIPKNLTNLQNKPVRHTQKFQADYQIFEKKIKEFLFYHRKHCK